MVPMFHSSDIVIVIGMIAFLVFYALVIIIQVIICRKKEHSFNLANVAVALVLGFAASVVTFFSLYLIFGQG